MRKLLVLILLLAGSTPGFAAGSVELVSRAHAGDSSLTPNAQSVDRGISGDGRYVLFESTASNITPGPSDTNGTSDVFLYDRGTRSVLLVSSAAGSATATGDADSEESVLSADGRYIAFSSQAGNLVVGVTDPIDPRTGQPLRKPDVFLFDRTTGATVLVSRSAVQAGHTGSAASQGPAISADGRWVAFQSFATDLVPGVADDNETADIYLWNRVTGATLLVSRSDASPSRSAHGLSSNPMLSADGRYVAYESEATDLVPGQTDSSGYRPARNIFLFDRVTGATVLVTHSLAGANDGAGIVPEDLPSLSADGRYVLFSSYRDDLEEAPGQDHSLYLFDRVGGKIALAGWNDGIGIGAGAARRISTLSADGRWIAFVSRSSGLVPGIDGVQADQLYLYDQVSKVRTLATPSLLLPGQPSQGASAHPSISADGRYVAFDSTAPDLVPGQLGTEGGVFLFDRVAGTRTVVSRSPGSPVTNAGGIFPLISADGQAVAFDSASPDLVAGDSNHRLDVFLYTSAGGGPVTVPPCSLFSGVLRSNARKVLKVARSCGVPAGAKQVAVKITVAQGTGKGNVQLYPGNVTAPASGILRFNRGAARTAAFTLPLSTNGTGTIALLPSVAGNGTVRVAVEVNGYVP